LRGNVIKYSGRGEVVTVFFGYVKNSITTSDRIFDIVILKAFFVEEGMLA